VRIGIFDLSDDEKKIMEVLLKDKGIDASIHSTSYDEGDYETIVVFVDSKITKEKIAKSKHLKNIITMSTGFDHIDLKACKKRKIKVYNVPDYGTDTVAEFTLLLMLASLRKLGVILSETKESTQIDYKKIRGKDLSKKTVGVVGTGRIGSRVAEICLSMGCKVIANSRKKRSDLLKKGVEYVDFQTLLSEADIITLHTALVKATKHMINQKNISRVKEGALIINTSRGPLIETKALISRADVLYAGLDVVEGEALLKRELDLVWKNPSEGEVRSRLETDLLMKNKNILITPHVAYDTEEAIYRILKSTVDKLELLIKGEKPKDLVAGEKNV